MGTWRNRINLLNTEENNSFDAERQVMDLLFCFSQVDEKSEDWKALIAKADQFMRKDGEVKQGNAEKIEKVLNDWGTGKNSPLKDCNEPDVLRYSAQSYLFRGYNAMKKYFSSVGFDLEGNLPKLKQETKECAEKVDSASAQPADIPSTEEENKNLRDYIQAEFGKAFYYGVERGTGQKVKPVDPYLNEIGPARDALDRQADLARNKIGATITESYESIRDSKKWYGKDDDSYTNMMQAVSAYMDTHREEAGVKGISANEKEKLEKAMIECDRYVEKHDGIKFTSVGAKRLDAAKKMLEEMRKLPEARNAYRKLVLDKAEEKAKKTTEEKLAKMAEKAKEQEKAAEAAKKEAERKKALEEEKETARKRALEKEKENARKAAEEKRAKMAAQERKKAAGPAPRDEEWFRMVSALMKQEKAVGEGFQRMDKVMDQYKSLTPKDQSRVHDMWVNQYGMGEDTWNMLKERNDVKERVPMTFEDLKNAEEKENPKPNRVPQKVTKELDKEVVQKTKNSKSL